MESIEEGNWGEDGFKSANEILMNKRMWGGRHEVGNR